MRVVDSDNFDSPSSSSASDSLYGNARMVRSLKNELRFLTPAEKADILEKYDSGMSITAVARLYECHYTTVGRILRHK